MKNLLKSVTNKFYWYYEGDRVFVKAWGEWRKGRLDRKGEFFVRKKFLISHSNGYLNWFRKRDIRPYKIEVCDE